MNAILAARGHDIAFEHVRNAHRTIWTRCQELYWSVDKDIPCRRQIEHFLEELALEGVDDATIEELEHAYSIAAVELPPALVDGAREVLEELHGRGLRLGLISNTGRTPGSALRRILEDHGVAVLFTAMVFSNEHGACKPEPSIFEELRRGLDAASGEIVFVGDNLYVDVHGAQRAGMQGVHFVPAMRGAAVAPPVEHGLEITPHATITELRALIPLVDRM
jgi:putative hydrolase of the HAD superfamily